MPFYNTKAMLFLDDRIATYFVLQYILKNLDDNVYEILKIILLVEVNKTTFKIILSIFDILQITGIVSDLFF